MSSEIRRRTRVTNPSGSGGTGGSCGEECCHDESENSGNRQASIRERNGTKINDVMVYNNECPKKSCCESRCDLWDAIESEGCTCCPSLDTWQRREGRFSERACRSGRPRCHRFCTAPIVHLELPFKTNICLDSKMIHGFVTAGTEVKHKQKINKSEGTN